MKHLQIRSLALQEWREQKRLKLAKVPTETNPSDTLTKPMSRERLVKLGTMVGLRGGPFGTLVATVQEESSRPARRLGSSRTLRLATLLATLPVKEAKRATELSVVPTTWRTLTTPYRGE